MSDVLVVATNKLRALEREVEELRQFIRRYENLQREANAQAIASGVPSSIKPYFVIGTANKRISIKDAVEDAASALLKDSFMTVEELLPKLDELGIRVGGEKRALNLSSMLSRSDKFVYDRAAGGWSLKKNTPSLDIFR